MKTINNNSYINESKSMNRSINIPLQQMFIFCSLSHHVFFHYWKLITRTSWMDIRIPAAMRSVLKPVCWIQFCLQVPGAWIILDPFRCTHGPFVISRFQCQLCPPKRTTSEVANLYMPCQFMSWVLSKINKFGNAREKQTSDGWAANCFFLVNADVVPGIAPITKSVPEPHQVSF